MSRRPVALGALVVACAALDGIAGLLVGLVVAVALWRGATGRQLLLACLGTLALVVAAVLLPGLPDRTSVSGRFVTDRLLAHHLAFGAAVLLVVGVLRDHAERGLAGAEADG